MVIANSALGTVPRTTVVNPSDAQNRYTFWLMEPVQSAAVGA